MWELFLKLIKAVRLSPELSLGLRAQIHDRIYLKWNMKKRKKYYLSKDYIKWKTTLDFITVTEFIALTVCVVVPCIYSLTFWANVENLFRITLKVMLPVAIILYLMKVSWVRFGRETGESAEPTSGNNHLKAYIPVLLSSILIYSFAMIYIAWDALWGITSNFYTSPFAIICLALIVISIVLHFFYMAKCEMTKKNAKIVVVDYSVDLVEIAFTSPERDGLKIPIYRTILRERLDKTIYL